MAYVRGARRHPSTRLVITPEMEAQIEAEIAVDSGIPRSRRHMQLKPCGTVAAYNRHRYNGEDPCADCKRANRSAEADRKARRSAA